MYSIKTDLGVSGNSTLAKELTVKGNAVFEKNLTVNGTVTFANATFTQITVSGAANLGSVSVTGAAKVAGKAELVGDVVLGTDNTNTTTVKGKLVADSDVSITGNLDAKASVTLGSQSTDIITVNGTGEFQSPVNMHGNVTIGDSNTSTLTVNSKAVFNSDATVKGVTRLDGDLNMPAGTKATFQDVTINGTLDGSYTIATGNFTNINVTGNIIASGATSRVESPRFNITGANGVITSTYNDPARPSDIKSSFQPYQISTNDLTVRNSKIDVGTFGDETFAQTKPGLIAKGTSSLDYVEIKGNATTGTARPFLDVKGDSKFVKTATFENIVVTGTATGIYADIDGAAVAPASVTATGAIKANTLESVTTTKVGTKLTAVDIESTNLTTVKDLVITGTVTGFTGGDVDGKDIAPRKVTIAAGTGAGLSVAAGVAASIANLDSATITNTGLIKTDTIEVANKATVKDLHVTGAVTGSGFSANIDGKDVAPNSVDVTTTLKVTGASTLGTVSASSLTSQSTITGVTVTGSNVNASLGMTTPTITVTGVAKAGSVESATIQAQPSGAGTVTIASDVIAAKDLHVSGTFSADSYDFAGANLAGIASISTTGNANIGGNLVVTGTFDQSQTDAVVKSLTSANEVVVSSASAVSKLPVLQSTSITATAVNAGTVAASSKVTAPIVETPVIQAAGAASLSIASNAIAEKDLTVNGELILNGSIDLSAANVATNDLHVNGDLSVDGLFDLTATNLSAATVSSVGATNVGTDLTVTGNATVNGTTTLAATTASTLTSTGLTKAATLEVTGAAALKGATTVATTLGVTGLSTLSGGIATTTVAASGNVTVTGATTSVKALKADSITANSGNLNLTGPVVAAGNLTVNGTLTPAGGLDISGAAVNAGSLTTTGDVTVGGDLSVTGTFDQSALDVTVKSLTTTGAITGGTLTSTGLTKAATLQVTGASTLSTLTTSGLAKANTLEVTGVTTLNGNITSANANVAFINPVTVSGNVTSTAKVKGATMEVANTGALADTEVLVVNGSGHVTGNLVVDGTITAEIDMSGRDIAPRAVNAATTIVAGGSITAGTSLNGKTAVIGTSGSTDNVLQVQGNMSVSGLIQGTLDQTTSDVTVKSLTTTTGDVSVGGKLNLGTTGAIMGDAVFYGKITVAGDTALQGLTASSASLTTTLKVTGASTLAAVTATNVTASGNANITGTLGVTGLTTVQNLTVNGTLTADIANLVTNSISTKKYTVQNKAEETITSGSYQPDGTSNVYNIVLGAATTNISPPVGMTPGQAGSWFIYIKQDATGGRAVTWQGGLEPVGNSAINTEANSVSICNIVYCGVGTTYDVFIAQRGKI